MTFRSPAGWREMDFGCAACSSTPRLFFVLLSPLAAYSDLGRISIYYIAPRNHLSLPLCKLKLQMPDEIVAHSWIMEQISELLHMWVWRPTTTTRTEVLRQVSARVLRINKNKTGPKN
ncbi:uncharacterized protein H6S33_008605 [Morchella sextelata]|uniref:uncharacterized protein n=1 Tax=Morchella sextelata TaxID=1174677 RepID=UPI001D03A4AC|nr:uncharacterized protein H6S33_008605 [Morchella sextelata]KAH0602524.1 hypothetical protein H6S33_008605 [Morchella sextelata]